MIEKMFLPIVLKIVITAILLCTYPEISYSWFYIQESQDSIRSTERNDAFKGGTKNFILSANAKKGNDEIDLKGETEKKFTAGADQIPVDVPLDILVKEAIETEVSLDRQLTANLRLRNIMEEYLSLNIRAKQALQGIKISPSKTSRAPQAKDFELAGVNSIRKRLRNEIENMLQSTAELGRRIKRQYDQHLTTGKPETEPSALGIRGERSTNSSSVETGSGYSEGLGKGSFEYQSEIIQLLLDIVGYVVAHKLAVLFWFITILLSSTISVLVLKK